MSNKSLKILGWSSRGLRCPDYTVDFTRAGGEAHRVSLIQMPNGTGKTTTLGLLRAALSGHSPDGGDWSRYPIADLAKPGGGEDGEFIVHLRHDERKYSIRLAFDFEDDSMEVYTTGPSGEEVGFNPPRALEQFLNANFVRFFVFDGELANELRDDTKQNAEKAIDALFQFSSFKRMGEWAEQFLRDRITQQAEAGGGQSSTEKGLNKKRNLVSRLESRIGQLQRMQADIETKLAASKARVIELENQSKSAIESKQELAKRMHLATEQEKQAELGLQRSTADLLDAMRDPQQLSPVFASKLDELRTSFDRVKLPENTAREWFEEIAEEDHCICGRPMGDDEREHIRQRSSQYLGSGDVAFLNQLKGEIANHVQEPFDEADAHVKELIAETRAASDAFGRAKEKVTEITEEAAAGDPQVEEAEQEIRSLRERVLRFEEELRRYRARDHAKKPEECFNIQDLERQLRVEQRNLDQLAETVELRWKTNRLGKVLSEIYSDVVKRMGIALAERVNESLEELMPDNAVRLEGVEKSLKFKQKKGASVGETLAVGYAFLTHLTDRSEFDLPLVIDTPAAPIDEHIREEIGKCLPKMVPQFIAFTISPERGSFINSLATAADGDVQYLTLFRNSNARLMGSLDPDGDVYDEYDDAVLVRGQEYFERFQDDAEYHRDQNRIGVS